VILPIVRPSSFDGLASVVCAVVAPLARRWGKANGAAFAPLLFPQAADQQRRRWLAPLMRH
jgi:hypothetical protein